MAYFGVKGANILLKEGYHKWTGKYDERGNQTEWAYFGVKGENILHKDGYHRVTGKYDERGNETEWAYFGVKGGNILLKEGYHRVTGKYDECAFQFKSATHSTRIRQLIPEQAGHPFMKYSDE